MQAKYQVWVDDSILIGHVYTDTTATEDDVKYMAIDFTAETWGDVEDSQINTCEIPNSYYDDLAKASAKDSIAEGM